MYTGMKIMDADNAKESIKKTILESIQKNPKIVETIATQKKAMFNENTHSWKPLKESTVRRKTYLKAKGELAREPESINIRHGDLYNELTNSSNYYQSLHADYLDIAVEVNKDKAETVKYWGRDVIDIEQRELNQITEVVTQALINDLKRLSS